MNSLEIFQRRLKNHWRNKYRNFRTVADWTVIVYLILPALVIGFFIYRSWWLTGIPAWSEQLPAYVFFILGYLMSWGGNIRTFVEEGDQIFLVKHQTLFHLLKKWGFVYSLILPMVQTMLFIVLLLPFFKFHEIINILVIVSFYMFVVGMNFFLMHVKYQLRKIENKWLQTFATACAFIIIGFLPLLLAPRWLEGSWSVIALSIVLGLLGIFAQFTQLKKLYLFEHDLNIELEEKMRGVQAIYQMSPMLEKTKVIKRKKPWLFRNSKQIFKKRTAENGFIELYYKVFLRNGEYVRTLLQITSITAAAVVIIPPLWIKIIMFVAFLIMASSWLDGAWGKIVSSHPFTKKYHEDDAYYSAKRKGIRVLYFLAIVFHLSIVSVGLIVQTLIANLL